MKKLALLLSLLILVSALFADYIEIGIEENIDPLPGPFYNYWKSSHAQTLYYSEELGGTNTFTSLEFNLERMSANYPELPNFTIKILAVELDQFTEGAYYDMTGATEVFTAPFYQPATQTGWFSIDIEDFEYDGTSDLIVDVEFGQLDNYDSTYYRNYKSASPGLIRMLEGHEDANYPATYDAGHEAYSNIRFHFFMEGAPGSPANPLPENFSHTVALTPELSWDFGENTENYDLILDSVYPPETMVVDNAVASGTGDTYVIGEDLDYQTTYYWRLIVRNSNRVESYGPIWSFTTMYAPVEEDFETNDFTAHEWEFEGGDWIIDETQGYSAYHSATSDLVPSGNTRSISVEKEVTDSGEISFAHKSDLGWSSAYVFYINDEEYGLAEHATWEYLTFPVSAGTCIFKWEITSSAATDQVWLDYISFPPTTVYDNDLSFRNLAGNDVVSAGATESYVATIKNIGNNDVDSYTVRLMMEGDLELASVSSTGPLAAGELAEYTLEWDVSESLEGESMLWGEIVYGSDDNPNNNIGDDFPIFIYPYGTTVITSTGFEDGVLPEGWTTEFVDGDTDWVYQAGGYNGNPSGAHTGSMNAMLYHNSSTPHITRLISPELNLGTSTPGTLEFWHTQKLWASDQDELKILYKDSPSSEWIELIHYTDNLGEWTQRMLELPSPSTSYFIAFEGIAKYGYGVCIDDVIITGVPVTYDNDMAAYGTAGPDLVTAGTTETYEVTVKNSGNNEQFAYTVKLMQEGGTELVSMDITTPIGNMSTVVHEMVWNIPEDFTQGEVNIYGEVVLAVDDNTNNNVGGMKDIWVLPAGTVVQVEEGFEGGEVPEGWNMINDEANQGWIFQAGGGWGGPGSAHDGEFNALFGEGVNGASSMLITPEINLGNSANGTLKFWHAQTASGTNVDQLTLYYKTSLGEDWVELISYSETVASWIERTVELPNPSTSYYIAFSGLDNSAHGTCVDDVLVTGVPEMYDNDLAAYDIAGNDLITAGQIETYDITVRNRGNNTADEYSVKIMQEGGAELASLEVTTSIIPGQTVVHSVNWVIPDDMFVGETTIYTQVVLAGDEYPTNDIGYSKIVEVLPFGTELLLAEDFEGLTIPEGWTEELDANNVSWAYQAGGLYGNPATAHGGMQNGYFGDNNNSGTESILVTPELNLGTSNPGQLRFWLCQKQNWQPVNDKLVIYYKLTPAGNWVELITYDDPVDVWTEQVVALTQPSTSFYLGFKGIDSDAYGVCIDDMIITGVPVVYDNDIAAYGTTGNELITAGTSEIFNVTVKNVGNNVIPEYTVKLMQEGNVELASMDITEPLAANELIVHQLTWNIADDTPGGITHLYGNVVMTDDDNPNNNNGVMFETEILPFGTEILISEDFEAGTMPTGWQEEYDANGVAWIYQSGGASGNPGNAHGGTFNALFVDGNNVDTVTRLVSPEFNLGTSNPGQVRFWHAQKTSYTANDQLRVLYKTSSTGEWILAEEIVEEVSAWTERVITLDEPSTSFYLAFEGIDMGGYGVCIDDLVVTGIPIIYDNDLSAGVLSGPSQINVGGSYVYNFTVRNVGNLTQDSYTIELLSNTNEVISSVEVSNPLAAEDEVVHNLVWNVPDDLAPGSTSIHAKVVMPGDENPGNNQTPNYPVLAYPAGYNEVSIGTGTEANNRLPVCFQYKNSLTETIYFGDEMSSGSTAGGIIESITYYSSFANNITDTPVKVWLGHTELETLEAGWVPSPELTLVYDNTVNYPAGENEIVIDLETPFLYMGGNLLVMTQRPFEDTAWTGTDNFYVTETIDHMDRTRYNRDNEEVYDPANPPEESFSFEKFPNVKFIFTMGATSSIEGHIYGEGDAPLAGAEILIEETGRTTFTDGNGMYILDNMLSETYNITASAFGYITSSEVVTVGEEETVTQDFTLTPLGVVAVSGQLVGSDLPDVGMANTAIVLSGYQLYETTTDASGNFSFDGVYVDHTYILSATYEGYENMNMEVVVAGEDLNLDVCTMLELTYPVSNIVAVQATDEAYVDLSWNTPGGGSSEFRYDDGVFVSSVGDASEGPNAVFGAVHDYNAILNSMSWYLDGTYYDHPTVNLYILGIGSNNMPDRDNVLYTATQVPNVDDEWNEYFFPEEVITNEGFFIGISTPNIYLSIGLDDGVGAPYAFEAGTQYFSTNWVDEATEWQDLGDLSPNYAKNFMIRAAGMNFGEIRNAEAANLSSSRRDAGIQPTRNSIEVMSKDQELRALRGLESYNIYRFPAMYQSDPEQWDLVASEVTDSLYTDSTWPALNEGNYRFAVKAVYTNGLESVASFSNLIEKTTGAGADDLVVPAVTRMNNNYPNPFNPSTTISFSLKENAEVTLKVYNIKGELVNTLVNETMDAGRHQIIWEGEDKYSRPCASGVYFYKMKAGHYSSTKKMILMK